MPIIVGARSRGVLRSAGRVADDVLLWAVPQSDLDHSVATVHQGYDSLLTSAGESVGEPATSIVPAPTVPRADLGADHQGRRTLRPFARRAATYAVLNNRTALRESWASRQPTWTAYANSSCPDGRGMPPL